MTQPYDKEFHPVIEGYIADYVENNLDSTEKKSFEEVCVYDDDIRELTNDAREGKEYLNLLRVMLELED